MAHTEQQLQDFMESISDDPETGFKMLLHVGDLSEAFASDEDWGALCEFAMKIEEERDESIPFMTRYKQAMDRGGFDGMTDAIHSDLHDFAFKNIRMGSPQAGQQSSGERDGGEKVRWAMCTHG